jgi:MFS family permease
MAERPVERVPRGPVGLVLGNRRMARLTAAVLVSSVGDPFSQTVSLVLLYQATRSPLAIGAAFGVEMVAVLTVGVLIGSAADRVDRRRLIVRLEIARGLLVAVLPVLVGVSVFLIYPALFLLGGIQALVQPSRQAAIPELVAPGEVGAANSLLLTAITLAEAAGFALAGTALVYLTDPRPLYLADAFTFAVAALLVATLGGMGGGILTTRLRGAVPRGWSLKHVRPLLVVAVAAVFFIGMLNPALLPLAYLLSGNGPSAFALLQVCLIGGAFVGSLAAGRISGRRRIPALALSIWVFGVGIFAVGLSPSLELAAVAIAISGMGNAVYSVTNNSALMESADRTNRGTLMSARFTLTQTAKAFGLAAGSVLTAWLGARSAFAAIGLGLGLTAAAYTAFLSMRARQGPRSDE